MSVTVDDCVEYLRDAAAPWAVSDGEDTTYPEIQDALDAETDTQLGKVKYPVDADGNPVASASLDEALKRRVARNLAMRGLPLSMSLGDADSGPVRASSLDPEIRRFEARYRKRTTG